MCKACTECEEPILCHEGYYFVNNQQQKQKNIVHFVIAMIMYFPSQIPSINVSAV